LVSAVHLHYFLLVMSIFFVEFLIWLLFSAKPIVLIVRAFK
jgi:hypothetical protein